MKSHSIITFLLTSTAILGASLLAKAAQDDYSENFKELIDYTPWTGGVSHKVGKTPQGWYVSNVAGMQMGLWFGATEVASYDDNVVTLTNQVEQGQNIPAYMSLGTTWNTAKINGLTPDKDSKDGGSFGGIKINEQPTAIEITYKSSSNNAQLIAYTWQGTWTSKEVPSNISTNPTKSTMLNRDQVVLNKEHKVYTESKDDNAKLLSSVEANLKATNGFTTVTIPLNNVAPATEGAQKFLNIIVSAGKYFSQDVEANASISVKEIKLVKDHTSQGLKANAEAEDTYYHLNEVNLDGATTIGYYSFDTQKATPEKPKQGKYITVYMVADGSIKRVLSE